MPGTNEDSFGPFQARVMFWIGVTMAVVCLVSIGAAEALMPDNQGGRDGVLAFYRGFGPGLILWGGVAVWAHSKPQRGIT